MYLLVVPGHVLVVRLLATELLLALTAIPLLLLCCVAFKVTFHLGLVFECSVTPWMWAYDWLASGILTYNAASYSLGL